MYNFPSYSFYILIIIFLAHVNINTFIFVLGVFLTDILHYIAAAHPAFLTFSSHLLIYL